MIRNLVISLLVFGSAGLSAQTATEAPPAQAPSSATTERMSDDQETQYYQLLQDGIKKSQDQYNLLKKTVDPTKADDKQKNALMNVATALEVKYTLYKNFYNTPSIQSPQIRQKLLQLFQKDFITLDDLTQLKKIVSQEKARMGVSNPTNSTSSSTAPKSPTTPTTGSGTTNAK